MGNEIKSGAAWLFAGSTLSRLMNMASMIVLARLLVPSDFGLIALANVTWELLAVFFSSGLLVVVVQAREDTEEFYNTAFLISLTLNLMLVAAALLLAPLAAGYYDSPDLVPVLRLLAATYAVNSLSQVQITKLKREMRFDLLTRVGIANQLADSIGMIVMAALGAGYWSLVVPKLVLAPVMTSAYFFISDWRPARRFSRRHADEIIRLSAKLLLNNLLGYLVINSDYLVVGKVLGQTSLGLYRFAYNLAQWPITNLVAHINTLSLPYFASIRDDPDHSRNQYLKMIRINALTIFPIFAGAALVAPLAFPLVFGEKWDPAVAPFQLICLFGMARAIGSPGGQVFLAHGRAGTLLVFNLVQTPVLIAALYYGTRYGIVGVAAMSLLVLGSGGMIFIGMLMRLMGIRAREMGDALLPAATSTVVMSAVVAALLSVRSGISWSWLVGAAGAGGLTYLFVLRLIHPEAFRQYLELAVSLLKGLRKKSSAAV